MPAAKPQVRPAGLDELLQRVREIAPVLEANARESEQSERLAGASVDALHSSGLFRFWWPAELGGHGCDLAEGIALIEAAAEVETSAAWNLTVGSLHSGFAGAYLADHAVEAVFADERLAIAGQMAPIGQATRVDGGLQVSGSWSFGSGIHQSNWVLGGAKLEDGPPVVVVVPRDQAIVDEGSWEVAGLSGTGSCNYTMTNAFVADGYWYTFPIAQRLRGGPVFDLSILAQSLVLHMGIPLGAARRSLDEITELAKTKIRAFSEGSVGRRNTFQRELAEAEAKFAAARLYVYDVARRTMEAAGGSEMPTLFLEGRAAARYVTDVAVEIATWAYRQGGGTSLRLESPLQRIMRDLLAAAQHVYVDDVAYTGFGGHLMGDQS